jgi:hypothetical protein
VSSEGGLRGELIGLWDRLGLLLLREESGRARPGEKVHAGPKVSLILHVGLCSLRWGFALDVLT